MFKTPKNYNREENERTFLNYIKFISTKNLFDYFKEYFENYELVWENGMTITDNFMYFVNSKEKDIQKEIDDEKQMLEEFDSLVPGIIEDFLLKYKIDNK